LSVPLTFTILDVIAVALRFFVRTRKRNILGWDDWAMLLALMTEIINRSLTTVSIAYDNRVPLTAEDALESLRFNYIALPFQVVVSVLARLSIVLLLIRLFGVHAWFKRFLIILFTLIFVLSVCLIPIAFCQVTPTKALWDLSVPITKRWNPNVFIVWASINQSVFTFSDLAFVLLPIIIIWRLNMPLRQKVGLIILLALSLLTMVMSIMRTVWIVISYSGNTLGKYNETAILTLAFLEGDMVIIMSCIPTLRSLVTLDLTGFGSSISNLFNRTKSKPSMLGTNYDTSGPYHDLEMSGRKLADVDSSHNV